MKSVTITSLVAFGLCVSASAAPLGNSLTYQGRLQSSGQPVNGSHDLTFTLWDAAGTGNPPTGGNPIGAAMTKSGTLVTNGLFTVQLNEANEFGPTAFNGDARWLQVTVDGTTLGPRQPLTAAPYALYAPGSGLWTANGANINNTNAGNVGIGTTAPTRPLHVVGTETAAILGASTGSTPNVVGVSGTANGSFGIGVRGDSPFVGVQGLNSSQNGTAVEGVALATTGATGTGVEGESHCELGRGVLGWNNHATGATTGVMGQVLSTNGTAVLAEATAATGTTYAVRTRVDSPSGYAGYFLGGKNYFEGSVGIGTNSPGHILDVVDRIRLRQGSPAAAGNSAGIDFYQQTPAADRAFIGMRNDDQIGLYGRAGAGWAFVMNVDDGNVGIGTTTPTAQLHVVSSTSPAISAFTSATVGGVAISGQCNTGFGVQGQTSSGTGVSGFASGTSGINYALYGQTNSSSGRGVYGYAAASTGTTFGVLGVTNAPTSYGVYGHANANSGLNYGVYGISDSPTGYGVYGTCVDNIGVVGIAEGTTGTNYGVWAESHSTSGRGLYAVATATSGTSYAVRAANSNTVGYAVYAAGDLGCSGTKAFVIEHPFDPENKYLKHYCAEGPEPYNIYSGSVRLDSNGQATITLPNYFAEINRDPRIQLTPAGASMPNLYASEDIISSRFEISGGKPGGKVFWEVKAVRNDRWVRTHGAPVEVAKDAAERGKYQHPELYGQPAEKGIDYRTRPEQADHPAPQQLMPSGR